MLIFGVRPISPQTTNKIRSFNPRIFMSSRNTDKFRSSDGPKPFQASIGNGNRGLAQRLGERAICSREERTTCFGGISPLFCLAFVLGQAPGLDGFANFGTNLAGHSRRSGKNPSGKSQR